MKYTNIHNLDPIVRQWLELDSYDHIEDVFSATQLLKPTRMIVLEKQHETELETDITDLIASRYGTALHDSFEKLNLPDCIQEQRFFAEVDGQKISGKPDILQKKGKQYILWDIKSTSVWTWVNHSKDEEYINQLSIYRFLICDGGKKVNREAKIIFLFTDWSKSKAKQSASYPKLRVHVENIKLMTSDETREFISDKLKDINNHINTPEPDLPLCTPDELWQKDDKWAVMREGRKIAVRVWDSENDCHRQMKDLRKGHHYIEFRPGKVNRCGYCLVRKWCSQFKELEAEGRIAD